MADDGKVKTTTRLWGDEVKLIDPGLESEPEVEYQFSSGRQFLRPK